MTAVRFWLHWKRKKRCRGDVFWRHQIGVSMSDRSPHEFPRNCWCVTVYGWPPIPVLCRKFRDIEWNSKRTAGLRDNRTMIIWLCVYNTKAFKAWTETIPTKISSYCQLKVECKAWTSKQKQLIVDQSTEKSDYLPLPAFQARIPLWKLYLGTHIMLLWNTSYCAKISGMKVPSKKAVRLPGH